MFPFAELYPALTEKYGDIPEFQQGMIRIAWNYCVGEKIRGISEPVLFRDGVLRVRVESAQWQRTLTSMKPEIISRINKYLKKNFLLDLRVETSE
jgi:predicted nucleic acid-binding Zn ribbon protein